MNGACCRRLILVGCGPCANANYLPTLVSSKVEIVAVVDAEIDGGSDRAMTVLAKLRAGQPLKWLISKDEWEQDQISPTTREWFESIQRAHQVDGLLIVSEARSHAAYTSLGIDLGLHVLVEKPLIVPSLSGDTSWRILYSQFDDLCRAAKARETRVEVMAQRRYHAGYLRLFRELQSIVPKYRVPVTSIEVSYSDGEWRLPWEFHRENHPYHRGYGILHHSGYHFVDLIARLVSLNDCLEMSPDTVEVRVSSSRLQDFLSQIPLGRYAELLQAPADCLVPSDADGEIDLWAQLRFLRDGCLITTATMNLVHNGFSRREHWRSATDVYKGNGRVKHERVTIHVGPLASLQTHSYCAESAEEWKLAEALNKPNIRRAAPGAMGSSAHFDLFCFRNRGVIGGDSVRALSFGQAGRNLMPEARARCLRRFLRGSPSDSALESHRRTNLLMALLAEALSNEAAEGFNARGSRACWRNVP